MFEQQREPFSKPVQIRMTERMAREIEQRAAGSGETAAGWIRRQLVRILSEQVADERAA